MLEEDRYEFHGHYGELSYELKVRDPSVKNRSSAFLHVLQNLISEARLSDMEKDEELSPEEFCAGILTALVEAWDEARPDGGEGAVPLLATLEDMLATLKEHDVLPTHVTRSGYGDEELEPSIESDTERN